MLPESLDSPRTRVLCQTLAPDYASCPHLRRESQSSTLRRAAGLMVRHPKGAFTALRHATRRGQADVGPVTAAPAAFAAVRTAPATAPATLSLKTLGMM